MKDVPSLNESVIRQRATTQSWARGLDYAHSGAVSHVVWRDGVLTAQVEGSQYEPYQVRVTFDPSGNILSAICTCPYDWGGDCKHIVATLLYLAHRPQEVERHPALADLLSALSREQLADLLLSLVAIHPEIVEDVEDFVQAPTLKAAPAVPVSPMNLALLQQQIKTGLRAQASTLYESYYEYEEDFGLGEALEPALEQVRALLDTDDARSALAVLEAATVAWMEGCRRLDQDFLADLEDMEDEAIIELGEAWAEAFLLADLTAEERAYWSRTLQEWMRKMFGGTALDIAITAAEQGWDYPPLVAAMQGHITEKGAWEGEPPDFADELAVIRLRVLERRGRLQEYLNLAEAEGQFLLYLQMLIRLNRSDQAFAEAREYLTWPSDVHTIARTLVEQGEVEKGLELAAHGLTLESPQGRATLAEWLRDEAQARGRADPALRAAWQALRDHITLENYRWLEKQTGEEWPTRRPEALQIVASSQYPAEVVDIYLHEKMYRQAMELADRTLWFSHLGKVIDAVKGEFPDWAFGKCRQQAEAIMDAGKADRYDLAVSWLRRGRDILIAAGRKTEWDAFLRSLLEKHERKYKLVPMLKGL